MRKWLLVPAILILAIGSIYWFIPSRLHVVQITTVHCPATAAFRAMSTQQAWRQWWPSKDTTSNTILYNGDSFRLSKTLRNTLEVKIDHGDLLSTATVYLLPLSTDSAAIQWKLSIPSGNNPFTRIQRYRQAVAIKENMAVLSNAFRAFAEKNENLYGTPISEKQIKDTLLIATKTTLSAYPSVANVYAQVRALKQYIAGQQAQQTGHPLLNITPLDSSRYQVMVALPVNKRLPDQGPFFQRNMIPRKFLFTKVQGGPFAIQQTLKQLQSYIEDFHRTVMALPFQMLVTDRSMEPDTSKWITHFYVPVY